MQSTAVQREIQTFVRSIYFLNINSSIHSDSHNSHPTSQPASQPTSHPASSIDSHPFRKYLHINLQANRKMLPTYVLYLLLICAFVKKNHQEFMRLLYQLANILIGLLIDGNNNCKQQLSLANSHSSNAVRKIQLKQQHPQSVALVYLIVILLTLSQSCNGSHNDVKLSANTVRTKYGLLRGIVVRSKPQVKAFLGVPYAAPPVGSLRFMPPITPSNWQNIRSAEHFPPVCPQRLPTTLNASEALLEMPRSRLNQLHRLLPLLSNQSEDCLYLNIYVPYKNSKHKDSFLPNNQTKLKSSPIATDRLSTILFIHGQSYDWSSGNPYDGSELAARGLVIVVTINYRLGIFGFLKTGGKESAQGNYGLMDLIAGLTWLKENLSNFNGNPESITVLGHGTGAALANILVVSPVAGDLIQHIVLVSGSALSPWAIQKTPLLVKRHVAEQTGCHGDMVYDDLAPCLRTKTVAELLSVKIDFPRFLVGFAPFIDGNIIPSNIETANKFTLSIDSPVLSASGIEFSNFPKNNLMFSLTSIESYLDLSAQDLEFGFNDSRRDRILRTFIRNNFYYHLNEIFAILKNEYTDWEKPINNSFFSRDATLAFLSDGHTASHLIKLGYLHNIKGGKGYFLHFKHRGMADNFPQRMGSVHGEDVPFWLGLPFSPLFLNNYTNEERQISDLMLMYLANFAKTGNPNKSRNSASTVDLPNNLSNIDVKDQNSISHHTNSFFYYNQYIATNNNTNLPLKERSRSAQSQGKHGPVKAAHYMQNHASYNQTYDKGFKSNSNLKHLIDDNNENNYKELPFWDDYSISNQFYLKLDNQPEIHSHYRSHKLSIWLNLIPQIHRHLNLTDQSMHHHQFVDHKSNINLYEGVVRPYPKGMPDDDIENGSLMLTIITPTESSIQYNSTKVFPNENNSSTQELLNDDIDCKMPSTSYKLEFTTSVDNLNLKGVSKNGKRKEFDGLNVQKPSIFSAFSNQRLPSYTTALIATIIIGCFLLLLNALIFAGIYHQHDKIYRNSKIQDKGSDAKCTMKNISKNTSRELEDGNSSLCDGVNKSTLTITQFHDPDYYDKNILVESKNHKNYYNTGLLTKIHSPTADRLERKYSLYNMKPSQTAATTTYITAIDSGNSNSNRRYNPLVSNTIGSSGDDYSLMATSQNPHQNSENLKEPTFPRKQQAGSTEKDSCHDGKTNMRNISETFRFPPNSDKQIQLKSILILKTNPAITTTTTTTTTVATTANIVKKCQMKTMAATLPTTIVSNSKSTMSTSISSIQNVNKHSNIKEITV